jgi:hypothetical protein
MHGERSFSEREAFFKALASFFAFLIASFCAPGDKGFSSFSLAGGGGFSAASFFGSTFSLSGTGCSLALGVLQLLLLARLPLSSSLESLRLPMWIRIFFGTFLLGAFWLQPAHCHLPRGT